MRELADLVIQKVESDAGTTLAPLPADDPRQRQPDITLARKVLGWDPRITLGDGLDHTIDYFRELLLAG